MNGSCPWAALCLQRRSPSSTDPHVTAPAAAIAYACLRDSNALETLIGFLQVVATMVAEAFLKPDTMKIDTHTDLILLLSTRWAKGFLTVMVLQRIGGLIFLDYR
jgi:hypothetical protein